MNKKSLSNLYLGLIFYTILVILWGAWVRISHSGDGCGASWPLCHDSIIPETKDPKTWVEYVHRLMSGAYGILVLFLAFKLRKIRDLSPKAYLWAKITFFFTVTESLLGAKLVLFGLVGSNDSTWRSGSMALHLINSLLLVYSTIRTYSFLTWGENPRNSWPKTPNLSPRWWRRLPTLTLFVLLIVGVTGTIAALSNTLFPVENLMQALADDLNPQSHFLIRLRGLHPLLGLSFGVGFTVLIYLLSESLESAEVRLKTLTFQASVLCSMVTIAGALTILFHAPAWMKLTHLTFIYLFWGCLGLCYHHSRFFIESPRSNEDTR